MKKKFFFFRIIIFLSFSAQKVSAQPGAIYFVNATATGANNGTTWLNAFVDLQPAINAAAAGAQIWVAAGTYKPTVVQGTKLDGSALPGLRYKSFLLKNDVKIYGGFVGNETLLSMRNWILNITILSGDIDAVAGISGGDAYNLILAINLPGNNTRLDGFTILGGNANEAVPLRYIAGLAIFGNSGGGIYNINSTPDFANLIVKNNYCTGLGAGIFNSAGSPRIADVTITNNQSALNGGGFGNGGNAALTNVSISGNTAANGGGWYNAGGIPIALNITISNNNATFKGGGWYNSGGNPLISYITISQNSAGSNGGGVYINSGQPKISYGKINNNTAGYGGGIYSTAPSGPIVTNTLIADNGVVNNGGGWYQAGGISYITNVTIAGNNASSGGGFYLPPGSIAMVRNTIIYGNTAPVSNNAKGIPAITPYSLVGNDAGVTYYQNGTGVNTPFNGAIYVNPLMSVYRLLVGSFPVNKGNNAYLAPAQIPDLSDNSLLDLAGITRIAEFIVDLGAYESSIVVVPLAVRLTNFSGTVLQRDIVLHWTTLTENNEAYYDIQFSNDGTRFTPCGRVTTAGNSQHSINYSFFDVNRIGNNPDGVFYYRIQSVNKDGKTEFTNIICVKEKRPESPIIVSIKENPFSSLIEFSLLAETDSLATILVLNAAGKMLKQFSIRLNKGIVSPVTITDAAGFPAGVYYLRVMPMNTASQVFKLIKR